MTQSNLTFLSSLEKVNTFLLEETKAVTPQVGKRFGGRTFKLTEGQQTETMPFKELVTKIKNRALIAANTKSPLDSLPTILSSLKKIDKAGDDLLKTKSFLIRILTNLRRAFGNMTFNRTKIYAELDKLALIKSKPRSPVPVPVAATRLNSTNQTPAASTNQQPNNKTPAGTPQEVVKQQAPVDDKQAALIQKNQEAMTAHLKGQALGFLNEGIGVQYQKLLCSEDFDVKNFKYAQSATVPNQLDIIEIIKDLKPQITIIKELLKTIFENADNFIEEFNTNPSKPIDASALELLNLNLPKLKTRLGKDQKIDWSKIDEKSKITLFKTLLISVYNPANSKFKIEENKISFSHGLRTKLSNLLG